MDSAARVLGAFLFLDLFAAFVLMILVGLSVRPGPERKTALKAVAGVLFFLAVLTAFIYCILWFILQAIG